MCHQGVRTLAANWAKWMAMYNRVKAHVRVVFLGVEAGYDDMYAIYIGLLGALFGTAAAALSAVLLSVGAAVLNLCGPREKPKDV
jgi:hypothetical protein